MRKLYLSVGLLFLALGLVVSACASSTVITSTSGATTATASQTIGQLAQAGQNVYSARCAKCHGDKGQGLSAPAIMGDGASLDKFETAQGMLNFVSTAMPMDAPGALSPDQYRQVLCFLLVQNNLAQGDIMFSSGQLKDMTLK